MNRLQPPKLVNVIFGGLRVFMALKALLCSGDDESPQHWSVLRAIHTLNSFTAIRVWAGTIKLMLVLFE
jgi:hypothetical protein